MRYTFVETPLFTKILFDFLSDEEYSDLQDFLCDNPESGDLVSGSGGVRKVRWGAGGRGKRGGVRIIYYLRTRNGEIWMLTLYGKSVRETIPANVLRQIREEIERE